MINRKGDSSTKLILKLRKIELNSHEIEIGW